MNMPTGYNETQASGDWTPITLGGHYLIIKQVSERMSSTGKPMIVVLFDFDQNDAQAGYFTKSFADDVRPDKKWPNSGTKYILVNDSDTGKTSKNFKTFCTCVERSNTGFEVKWIENWGAQFKGKKVGGVFGEELDFYDSKEKRKHVLRWFMSFDKVKDAKIPEISMTRAYKDYIGNGGGTGGSGTPGDQSGLMNIPDTDLEELPFA